MKSLFLSLMIAFLATGLVQAAELHWFTDYSAAKAAAQTEHKPMLLDFTGSDWCGWCMRLDREVFDTPLFVQYATTNLILVKVDFPQAHEQAPAEKAQNEALLKKYGVQGFPTVLLLSPDEKLLLTTGYEKGGPQPYIATLSAAAKK